MAQKRTEIKTNTHTDDRVNIPTQELSDFMTDEQRAPKKVLYPRDPSLDPQLVWKGKDEQDAADLEVEARPIYIQEKIHPKAIIDAVKAEAQKAEPARQMDLFSDFNGIAFEQQINFYQHTQHWTNRLILGDSLQVMASLAEKENLKGQVQMIYLDPPYGIKFGSNWQVSTRKRNVTDGNAGDLTRQPEQVKAFRDTWELGIHSYLAYLRDRLTVARDLLTDSGSVFVQIGDENVHLVRCVMDEVFGAENFVSDISFVTTGGQSTILLASVNDHILWYAKAVGQTKYRQLYYEKGLREGGGWAHSSMELENGERIRPGVQKVKEFLDAGKNVRPYSLDGATSQGASSNPAQDYLFFEGKKYHPGPNAHWKTTLEGMNRLALVGRIESSINSIRYVRFLDDFPVQPVTNSWTDTNQAGYIDKKLYVVQTITRVIERCLLMTTDPGDLVLDPTMGSGTTAYVAEQWGRRWITCDTSRVAVALARTRLMSARFPYFTLADSSEGIKQEAELRGQLPPVPMPKTEGNLRRGFVYKRVPHIMLKHIANNPEIDAIHAKWQTQLAPIRQELNTLLTQSWEEWEIPHQPQKEWPDAAKKLQTRWWELRQQRQAEIDASITRHAEQEILYDQPYEDKNIVRVTGPFTVESLSPHRHIVTADALTPAEQIPRAEADTGQFEQMILDNLRKAGVQNTKKQERLKFTRLEPFAGEYLQAEGEFTGQDGIAHTVAVCIGPEYGTVGKDLIKDAAREAVRGLGFNLLLICGFAFDPDVAEEAGQYGRLTVLPVRMNSDLTMGEDLLKKTGSGNLFMVIGEPDLQIDRQKDGKVVVTLRGLDIYDPTTGQIRSSSTADIACWFIDTDYDGYSFFVRHAYFTGAGDPYDQLKRALRAEIDEDAWNALYRTVSLPFDTPVSGKIAVKLINHFGDEVLKVYGVGK